MIRRFDVFLQNAGPPIGLDFPDNLPKNVDIGQMEIVNIS